AMTLMRTDGAGGVEHGQSELAGGCANVANREVCARDKRPLARHRRDAVRLENLSVEDLGSQGAHAAGGASGKPIKELDIPRVARAGILDIEAKLSPLP